MKLRDSGMPEESYWETLFDVPFILERLGIDRAIGDVAELGCGYGTFTVPIAKIVSGTVYTFDIDPAMVERTCERATGLPVVASERDVFVAGFGVTVDAVLLFNILHCDEPERLIEHAKAALRPDGQLFVIHWEHRDTPRGPSLAIRPKPERVVSMARGFHCESGVLHLPPWHYGLRFALPKAPIR